MPHIEHPTRSKSNAISDLSPRKAFAMYLTPALPIELFSNDRTFKAANGGVSESDDKFDGLVKKIRKRSWHAIEFMLQFTRCSSSK
mmetsp:Transcript_19113/g.41503  ORF Transcript_19113/g.41503 Transcript_19113/m.41503 type:complete len:86 (+) Transcript_19113:500-757(+)